MHTQTHTNTANDLDNTKKRTPMTDARRVKRFYVLKVSSIDGLMPFLVACHCTIFIVIVITATDRTLKINFCVPVRWDDLRGLRRLA